jgi:hypothetical protein
VSVEVELYLGPLDGMLREVDGDDPPTYLRFPQPVSAAEQDRRTARDASREPVRLADTLEPLRTLVYERHRVTGWSRWRYVYRPVP